MEKLLPVDGYQKMPNKRKWLLAPHQWKWPLMSYPAKNINTQRQMVGQMTSSVWHLLTQWHRRCQSDSCSNKNEPTEAERVAQGWCESCVRGRGGCVRERGRAACVDAARITLTEGWQDQDEGYPQLANRSMRLFLLQSGEGGHQMQEAISAIETS